MSVLDLEPGPDPESERYRQELISAVKAAVRRGHSATHLGSLLGHDPSLVRKLISNHRFKPSTLRAAHARLKRLAPELAKPAEVPSLMHKLFAS